MPGGKEPNIRPKTILAGAALRCAGCLACVECCASGSVFYPKNHVGRGWGIRNGAIGAVRLPNTLVLTIDDHLLQNCKTDPPP